VSEPRYADPGALRKAITDRLRHVARDRPGAQLSDLQRQFAYDRLLARVFSTEAEAWVLKGATSLLARLHGAARHTLDIDLYRRGARLDEADAALRAAASADVGDYFRFTLEPGRRIAEGGTTLRVPVTAYLGAAEFARFHVDLVSGVLMTGEPDDVSPLVPIELPGIPSVHYRAYPIVDHIADKVCALVELHPRAGRPAQASTRYRDLADLAVIAHTQSVDVAALRRALTSESGRRRIELPTVFSAPDAAGWRSGYARVAKDVPGLAERDLEAAMVTVKGLLDPALGGTARGSWRPDRQRWSVA
jgi:Nucleotidyl transferase AbiEii toxin, Type IV TA system